MKKDGFLNAMAVIGYCIVFVFVVCSVILGVKYIAGGFNTEQVPIEGLKFDQTEAIISETGGTVSVRVYSKQAAAGEEPGAEGEIIDPATPVELKLVVRNMHGDREDSIITVPEKVMLGEPIEITAKISEIDSYNIGGECQIIAYTVDEMYKSSPITVFVDVPVEGVEIVAKDHDGKVLDLAAEDAKFVKDDSIQLSVNVTPARALNPAGSSSRGNKSIEFETSDSELALVDEEGVITIRSWNDKTGLASFNAKVESVYGGTTTVMATCSLNIVPITLNEIVIRHSTYSAPEVPVGLQLFQNKQVKLSAKETNDPDIINLNIFLQPEYYNEASNPDPLGDRIQDLRLTYSSSNDNDGNILPMILTIETNERDYDNNIVWTVIPNREPEATEVVTLAFSLDGYDQPEKALLRTVAISLINPTEFTYVDSSTGEMISSKSIQISKNRLNDGTEEVVAPLANINISDMVHYTIENDHVLSYSKFVYIVEGLNNAENLNITGSKIINSTEYGEVVYTGSGGVSTYSTTIQPLGAGTVNIVPCLVRTNKSGQPVDKLYQVIRDGEAVGIAVSPEKAKEKEYMVYRKYPSIKITVTEALTSLTLYFDEALTQPANTNDVYDFGTYPNKLTLYARANSALALPENDVEYSRPTFKKFRFDSSMQGGSEPFRTEGDIKFFNIQGETYIRGMSFVIYANEECRGELRVSDTEGTQYAGIKLNSKYIPADNLKIVTDNTDVYMNNTYNNVKVLDVNATLTQVETTNDKGEQIYRYRAQWYTGAENTFKLPVVEYFAADPQYIPSGQASVKKPYLMTNTADINAWETLNTGAWLDLYKNNSLVSAEEYAEILAMEDEYGERFETVQLKKPIPQNTILIIVYQYAPWIAEIHGDATPDCMVLNITCPEITFGEVQTAPEEGVPVVNPPVIGTMGSQVGCRLQTSTLMYARSDVYVNPTGDDVSRGIVLSLDEISAKYFDIQTENFMGVSTTKLLLKSGYKLVKTPGEAQEVLLTQVTVKRVIEVVLDIDSKTSSHIYRYVNECILNVNGHIVAE